MESRKRRRGWVVALGAGLLTSLVPGCRTPGSSLTPTQDTVRSARPGEHEAVAKADAGASTLDYVRIPPPTPTAATAKKETPVTTVASAGTSANITTAPPAPTLPPNGVSGAVKLPPLTATPPNAATVPDVEPKHVHPVIPVDRVVVERPTAGHAEESESKDPPLVAALRCYIDKKPREALDHLAKYDKLNQETLLSLLVLAVQFAEVEKPSEQQTSVAIEALESVIFGLRARAPLAVEKMCLCKWIKTFGVYDPMPEDHVFAPGEQVRVYAELRNFSIERQEAANGAPAVFVTKLAGTAEIRDPNGKSVWKQQLQRDEADRSQTPRHDYFDHYHFFLPDLKPGWYTLEVTVEDVPSRRKARSRVDLKVGLLPQGS